MSDLVLLSYSLGGDMKIGISLKKSHPAQAQVVDHTITAQYVTHSPDSATIQKDSMSDTALAAIKG